MLSYTLCGNPKGGCCPTVERTGNVITIKDDFGGIVNISYEQYLILKKKVL